MRNIATRIIGIDASTTNIGLAFYNGTRLEKTKNISFKGTFDLDKLHLITKSIETIIADENPEMVIIEEPITAHIQNTRSISTLNQVAGAICAVAFLYEVKVKMMHNKTAKASFGIKHKHDVSYAMLRLYPYLEDKKLTEHELDAVLIVEAYNKRNVS